MIDGKYWTVQEVATRLRLSTMTIYRLILSGEMVLDVEGLQYRLGYSLDTAYEPHVAYDLMTIKEVAANLGVSEMTVYRLLQAQELSYYVIACNYRIARIDLSMYQDKLELRRLAALP